MWSPEHVQVPGIWWAEGRGGSLKVVDDGLVTKVVTKLKHGGAGRTVAEGAAVDRTSLQRTIGAMDVALEDRSRIVAVARAHGATSVRLFGSRARGDSSPRSDIDLLVTLEDGRSLLDLVAIKQDLEDLLGTRVDVVTERALSPRIRPQILAEATLLS